MLSNFRVVFVITWNLSVGLGATGPGAAPVEPQDASAPASMNATAAASTDLPRTRLMRWSPRAVCFDLDADPRGHRQVSGPPGRQDWRTGLAWALLTRPTMPSGSPKR